MVPRDLTVGTRVRVRARYGDLPAGWDGTYVGFVDGRDHRWSLIRPDGYRVRRIAVRPADVERRR